jgi:hypothetical protein
MATAASKMPATRQNHVLRGDSHGSMKLLSDQHEHRSHQHDSNE